MSYEEVKDIISCDDLCVESEEIIYKVVIDWIKHDLDNRKMYLTELMSHVRFPLINETVLLKCILNEPLMLNFQLMTAVKNQLYTEGEHDQNLEHTRHRKSKTNIFIAGERCQMFDSSWNIISIPDMNFSKTTCVVTFNKKVYTFSHRGAAFCGEVFDPLTNKWSVLPRVGDGKLCNCINACVLGNLIYVCRNTFPTSDILYVFNTETSKWNQGPSRPFTNIMKSVVVQNAIYYFGESVAYHFDSRESQWKSLTPLSTKRSSFCLVADKTYAYCIGGKDDRNNVMATVERYDVRNNKWESVADILYPRFDHAAVIKDNYIHVLGGKVRHHDVDLKEYYACVPTVEICKPIRNKWTVLDNVNIKCSKASAVTLKKY